MSEPSEFMAYGQWWETEIIKASTPYFPRMTPAPIPTVESYESQTLSVFRKMEIFNYIKPAKDEKDS